MDRADALAAVFETDRTDILISALRESLRDAAHSDEITHLLLDSHTAVVPERVVDELTGAASYDDASDEAAQAVLDRRSAFEVRSVDLDETFPLDDGENAAVTLANETDAVQLLCDEFTRLALVHASLAEARLVTTPILLTALVRNDALSPDTAETASTEMSAARSWTSNTYVERAKATLRRRRGNG